MQKKSLNAAGFAALWFFAAFTSHAGEIGHYNGGLLNIRDYFVPEPGFYSAVYNYFYTSDRLNDSTGNKIDAKTFYPSGGPVGTTVGVNVDLDLYALAPVFIYSTELKSIGLKLGALAAPTFANASMNAQLSLVNGRGGTVENSSFAVGDLFVQPAWLGYSLPHWDFSVAYGFYAPVGKYDITAVPVPGSGGATFTKVEDPDNIGYGFWTHQFQGGVAWYPWSDKRMAITSILTYERNLEKRDFEIRPGSRLSLNWGVSQFLPLRADKQLLLEIGPAGYDSWQITDDTGDEVRNGDVHDSVHAVGGQLGIVYIPWSLAVTAHGYYEYASKDRFQGSTFMLSIVKKF